MLRAITATVARVCVRCRSRRRCCRGCAVAAVLSRLRRLGRVLGGVATSLLFSSFESWMVCEHNARGYDAASLNDTFSLMYFGNSLCAILAGLMAESAANLQRLTRVSGVWHYGGYCSPFDLSALFLVLGLALISSLWSENYGAAEASSTYVDTRCHDA